MRNHLWLSLVSLIVVCCGCSTDHLRWETEIDAEGKITRRIHLPVDKVPADCLNPVLWDRSGYTDGSPEKAETLNVDAPKLSPNPKKMDDKNLSYFAARGTFDSADEIPTHYRIRVGETDAVSENQTNLQIKDYLMFKEYVWKETLTETVNLKDVPRVRRELVEMIVSFTQDTLDRGLDDVYDASALIEWMKTEGDRWIEEVYGVYLSAALKQTKPEEFPEEFAAVCQRYGLRETSGEEVRKFLENLLREKLRRTDGMPVEESVVTSIVTVSGLSLKQENEPDSPLDKVLQQVILEKYQSQEQAQEAIELQFSKLVGVHGIPLFMAPEEYQVTLKMPGRIVETDATLRADGELRWTFKDEQVAPFGFEMSGRSIVPDPESQKQNLSRQIPLTNAQIDRILELFSLDESLRQVMIDCGNLQSLDPLKTYRDQFYQKSDQGHEVIDSNQDDERHRADELWEMLSSPDNESGTASGTFSLFDGRTFKPFGILFSFVLMISLLCLLGKKGQQSEIRQT